jgi:uncharacterized repeat protein (TIGR01451 family)
MTTVQGITVSKDQNIVCTFTNTRYGSIAGKKFNDINGDHAKDTNESYLSGWTIRLDQQDSSSAPNCTSGTVNGEYCEKVTNSSGSYSFTKLLPGTYIVSEVAQTGWVQTRPDSTYGGTGHQSNGTYVLTVTAGQSYTGRNFGNQGRGSITVVKNSSPDSSTDFAFSGTNGLGSFSLDDDSDGTLQNTKTFSSIPAGSYSISEGLTSGWTLDNISCQYTGSVSNLTTDTVELRQASFDLGAGADITCTYTNVRDTGSLTVKKIVDLDGDTSTINDQTLTSNWQFDVDGAEGDTTDASADVTGEDGSKTFSSLKTGKYTVIETIKDGYRLVDANCDIENGSFDQTDSVDNVWVSAGDNTICTFYNTPLDPVLTINKLNDASTDKTPGGSVNFTIKLHVSTAQANNLKVEDLLPAGFVYRTGTYHATVNGLPVSISEPTYHSPGTWSLGDVPEGADIVLTYTADISSTTDPGLYTDLAWAQATSLSTRQILALADESSKVDENFVGTEVNVVKDQTSTESYSVEKKETLVGEVLGASTTLPATGASPIWMMVALLGFVSGLRLIKSSNKSK